MALTFPLTRAQFIDTLRVATADFELGGAVEQSRTASGEIFTAALGARLWQGKIVLADAYIADADAVHAALRRATDPDASFLLYDPFHAYPKADPTGSVLGASSVTIGTIAANNRELSLVGLPAGYVISAGDYLSFTYGSSPTRYAFHQVVTGATASGGGTTGNIEVMPAIRTGAAAGAAVTLKQPAMKAIVVPGSLSPRPARPLIAGGLSFEFQQTLR